MVESMDAEPVGTEGSLYMHLVTVGKRGQPLQNRQVCFALPALSAFLCASLSCLYLFFGPSHDFWMALSAGIFYYKNENTLSFSDIVGAAGSSSVATKAQCKCCGHAGESH